MTPSASFSAPRPARSIHSVLLLGTIALLLVVLGGVAWFSYDSSEHEAEELFDARLATSARVLEALVSRQVETATIATPIVITLPRPLETATDETEATPLGHYYETKIAFQVWRAGDELLVRSASAPGIPFAPMQSGFSTQRVGGHDWRVFVLQSDHAWIQVAERDDARTELAATLALIAVAPLALGAPVLLGLLSLLIRYGVAPLHELARRIRLRRPDSFEPMTLPREPSEIVPVTRALNGLVQRMQQALARERRFTADAAHELRTPLAAMQIHAQNALYATSDTDRGSLERLLAALKRTVHLGEQMLAYSRASAPVESQPLRLLALQDVVADVVGELEPRFRERGIALMLSGREALHGVAIRGERAKLASVVGNLLENALNCAPAGSRVDVELTSNDGSVTMCVADSGPGIPAELRERVFESYFRIPGSTYAGSGLGLAIVKEIAAQHGATVVIGDGPGGIGTRISVTFPAAPADGRSREDPATPNRPRTPAEAREG